MLQITVLCVLQVYQTAKPMAYTVEPNPVLAAFERMKRGLHQVAARITGNDEDAEDALQEAFVRLWLKRDSIHSTAEAAAIMTTTVRNLSIDEIRRRQRGVTVELDEQRDGEPDPNENLQQAAEERYREVETIIRQRLTPTQQTILRMRDYDDRDYDEIAALLQMQPAAVRMQLSRARKTIREVYNAQHSSSNKDQ